MPSIENIADPSRAFIDGWVANVQLTPMDSLFGIIASDDDFVFQDSESGARYYLANSFFLGRSLGGKFNFTIFFVEVNDGFSRYRTAATL